VVAQLLGKLKHEGLSIKEALQKLPTYCNKESKWGIVLIDKDDINTIYTATK
jgi:hypothetical protein